MFNFFETVHFSLKGQTNTQLHSVFSTFKSDYQSSIQLRDLNSDKFTFVLHQKLKKVLLKIQKYHTICTTFPDSIKSKEIDNLLSNVKQIKTKLEKMQSEVESLKHYQDVVNFKGNDFTLFYQVLNEANFMTNLFTSISQWNKISTEISKAPLMTIDMPVFITEINTIPMKMIIKMTKTKTMIMKMIMIMMMKMKMITIMKMIIVIVINYSV